MSAKGAASDWRRGAALTAAVRHLVLLDGMSRGDVARRLGTGRDPASTTCRHAAPALAPAARQRGFPTLFVTADARSPQLMEAHDGKRRLPLEAQP